ncbi:hypothetical protein [Phenylobacterium sp.]|jgi:hypothetical protein|uniref:hypothetical protein n=1 Tax=Phenylobacterium sp. TaxID=1871053 RepID=UPI002F93BC55
MDFVETSRGRLRIEALQPPPHADAPVVVVVNGVFPSRDYLRDFRVEGAGATLVWLPAMSGPGFARYDLPLISEALGEAVERLHGGRRVVLGGFSTGASAVLGVATDSVRAWVAVEPFLDAAGLWPLQRFLETMAGRLHPEQMRFVAEALGLGPAATAPRRFEVRAGQPLHVVAGDRPLESPALGPGWPSLTSAADREALAAAGARLWTGRGGHGIYDTDRPTVMAAFEEAIRQAAA